MPPRSVTPLNILLFTEFFHPRRGGIESHVQALAQALTRAGMRVTVATPFPGPDTVDGIRVHRVRTSLLPYLQTIWTVGAARPFVGFLEREKFDLVHTHVSVYNPAAAPAAYLAHRAGIPVVVTFHSILGGYIHALGLIDRLTGWTRFPWVHTALSENVASDVSRLLHGKQVTILPPAWDLDAWVPAVPETESGYFRIVSTMRLARRKRPRALVELLGKVKARLPSALRMRARIIGDGPERPWLARRIRELGLDQEVALAGALSHESIREEYRRADAFVLASREESFGLAALEARAVGLPVVVRAGTGPTHFIQHERDGLVGRTDGELADALLRLAGDSALRGRIAEHNRTTRPPFGNDEMVRRHAAVYAAALAG